MVAMINKLVGANANANDNANADADANDWVTTYAPLDFIRRAKNARDRISDSKFFISTTPGVVSVKKCYHL